MEKLRVKDSKKPCSIWWRSSLLREVVAMMAVVCFNLALGLQLMSYLANPLVEDDAWIHMQEVWLYCTMALFVLATDWYYFVLFVLPSGGGGGWRGLGPG